MVNSGGRNLMIFRMFGLRNYNTNNTMTDLTCAILAVIGGLLIYILL